MAGAGSCQNALIHQLYVRQQFRECSELIEQALQQAQGQASEYPTCVKALIERQHGRIASSLMLFKQAVALDPSIANLKQVARSLLLLGKHRAALEVYDEALKLAAEDWELWLSKGTCAAAMHDHEQALECFRKANAIQPSDAAHMQMGALHMARGELDAALATYAQAVEHSPENPELLTTLGIMLLRLGDNQRAFDQLGTSLLHDPRNPRTLLAVGSVIQDHQDMDVALVKYRVAAAVCPDSPQLWSNIGMCFFAKQRYIAAIACLKRALYLGPLEWVVAHNLGLAHLATGQAASAFHFLSTAINLKPDFAHSYAQLAVALERLEDPENAAAAYSKAISLAPAEPLFRLNYGILLCNQGDAPGARAQLAEFTRLLAEGAVPAADGTADAAAALEQELGSLPPAAGQ